MQYVNDWSADFAPEPDPEISEGLRAQTRLLQVQACDLQATARQLLVVAQALLTQGDALLAQGRVLEEEATICWQVAEAERAEREGREPPEWAR